MKSPIIHELKHHAPFTLLGAFLGIVFLIIAHNMPYKAAHTAFYVFHPLHVVLSALVTSSMYRNYKCKADRKECNLFALLAVGFVGSIGIATLSDSVMPYLGEIILGLPHAEAHIGFIEKPYLILSLAALGIAIAYYKPQTHFPHAGHVLISTWASLFHVMMAMGKVTSAAVYAGIFIFLFVAVWIPCCVSDIVFPLLFVGKGEEKTCFLKH